MPGGCAYRGTRTATVQDCGTIANTATVALGHSVRRRTHQTLVRSRPSANNTAATSVSVVCQPGIAITKMRRSANYEPGQPIIYTVVVTNSGQTTVPFGQIR